MKVLTVHQRRPKRRRFVAGTKPRDDFHANLSSSQNVVYDTTRLENQFFPVHFGVPQHGLSHGSEATVHTNASSKPFPRFRDNSTRSSHRNSDTAEIMPSSQEFLSPKIASFVLILLFQDSDRFAQNRPLNGLLKHVETSGPQPKELHPQMDFPHKTSTISPSAPCLWQGFYGDFVPISPKKLSTHAVLTPRF